MSQLELTKSSKVFGFAPATTARTQESQDKTKNRPTPSFAGRLFTFFQPLLRASPPQMRYDLTRFALRAYPFNKTPTDFPANLKTRVMGLDFPSPLGIGAGFDKDGNFFNQMLGFSAGFVEIGTATPRLQKSNPAPIIHTLDEEKICLNAMGFPSKGIDKLIKKLARKKPSSVLGVNIGANRDSTDKIQDYALCVDKLNQALVRPDYITINVSSPNTAGLRDLQALDQLARLLDSIETTIPLLVKLSPDMETAAYTDLAQLALDKNLSGIVATNTTSQHDYKNFVYGGGGLSGAPLREKANGITRTLYQTLGSKLPIIGVGGIASGLDAYERIRSGASLIQLYTGLIWGGPDLIKNINHDLSDCLEKDDFNSVAEAVGVDA